MDRDVCLSSRLEKLNLGDDLMSEEAGITDERITINYADFWCFASVASIDVLKGILLVENRKIVLFGERNFTFTLAFAALHKKYHPYQDPWQGIISTCLEPDCEGLQEVTKAIDTVKLKNIKFIVENESKLEVHTSSTSTMKRIKDIIELSQPIGVSEIFKSGIDATKVRNSTIDVHGKVVWLQCPWCHPRDDVGRLLRHFLRRMAMNKAEYILLGIVNEFWYARNYELGTLFGLPKFVRQSNVEEHVQNSPALKEPIDVIGKYDFLGADKKFVKNILQYGYKHEGCTSTDIHSFIIKKHVTLVFRQKTERPS